MSVFLLLDLDDSNELEPEEILDVFMDRKLLGQSREEQAKQDAINLLWKSWAGLKLFVSELAGNWECSVPTYLIEWVRKRER